MGRRLRELEQTVLQKDNELAQLRLKIEELNSTVAEFREKESAIAGAMTKAQAIADTIIADAENEKNSILNEANERLAEAKNEADGIIGDAERRAEMIVDDAKANARDAAAKAESFMEDYRNNASRLNEELRKVALSAAEHAKGFKDYIETLNLDAAIEMTEEYTGLQKIVDSEPVSLPDDYDSPEALMKSIYSIEQRNIPDFDENRENGSEPENVAVSEPESDPAGGFEADEPEDKVWTVDDILKDAKDTGDEYINEELDAIINDVLKET